MNRFSIITGISLALSLSLVSPGLKGQLYQADFIYSGVEDAEKILREYLTPLANIVGSDLNA